MVMPESLRICMVMESSYPVVGGGGAEGQLRTLSRHLCDCGHRVTVVVPMTPQAPQKEYDEIDGIPLYRIPYPKIRLLGGLVMLFRCAWYLYRKRHQYDVIHAHIAHRMAAVACIIGWLARKPVLVKLTGWLETELGVLSRRRLPWLWLMRRALGRATAFQATSRELADRLIEYGFPRARVHLIPNAVDTARFQPGIPGQSELEGGLVFIFVGRLVPEKNLEMLIDAWAQAIPGDSPHRLLLVGKGPLQALLERRIRDAGVARQVSLFGARPREEVGRLLAAADVGVLVSTHEGLSNSLLEYLAAGLPVIGTRISGTEDWIEDGVNGWLVESGDTAGLARLLKQVAGMDRQVLRDMGTKGRALIEENASIESVARSILRLYGVGGASRAADMERAA